MTFLRVTGEERGGAESLQGIFLAADLQGRVLNYIPTAKPEGALSDCGLLKRE
jgi:hypothetical protein